MSETNSPLPEQEEVAKALGPDGPDADGDSSGLKKVKFDPTKLQPGDFFFGRTLGEGAYARVVHAKFKKNEHEFAIKIMEKRHIKKENKVTSCALCLYQTLFMTPTSID
jgi:hypothetical protein